MLGTTPFLTEGIISGTVIFDIVSKKFNRVITKKYLLKPGLNNIQISLFPEEFVFVEQGSFLMGTPGGDSHENPVHKVTLDDFFLSKYEVTQEEYNKIMGMNPSDKDYGIGANLPVNTVTWYDAIMYCNSLSEHDGLNPSYLINENNITLIKNANGYRLPTEAEWEYAARGGNTNNVYRYTGSDNIWNVGWYTANSSNRNNPVGKKDANVLGLYDMSGNVAEWCWDWSAGYISGSVSNPKGPSLGWRRVGRGGSWNDFSFDCRVSSRAHGEPLDKEPFLGFRVLLPVVPFSSSKYALRN